MVETCIKRNDDEKLLIEVTGLKALRVAQVVAEALGVKIIWSLKKLKGTQYVVRDKYEVPLVIEGDTVVTISTDYKELEDVEKLIEGLWVAEP